MRAPGAREPAPWQRLRVHAQAGETCAPCGALRAGSAAPIVAAQTVMQSSGTQWMCILGRRASWAAAAAGYQGCRSTACWRV